MARVDASVPVAVPSRAVGAIQAVIDHYSSWQDKHGGPVHDQSHSPADWFLYLAKELGAAAVDPSSMPTISGPQVIAAGLLRVSALALTAALALQEQASGKARDAKGDGATWAILLESLKDAVAGKGPSVEQALWDAIAFAEDKNESRAMRKEIRLALANCRRLLDEDYACSAEKTRRGNREDEA